MTGTTKQIEVATKIKQNAIDFVNNMSKHAIKDEQGYKDLKETISEQIGDDAGKIIGMSEKLYFALVEAFKAIVDMKTYRSTFKVTETPKITIVLGSKTYEARI